MITKTVIAAAIIILSGLLFTKDGRTTASWYGEKYRGMTTASGEPFDPDAMTAAMWDVPFGTRFRVTYYDKSVIVKINDRGPAKKLKRGIDLSKAAFKKLAPTSIGLLDVKVERIKEKK